MTGMRIDVIEQGGLRLSKLYNGVQLQADAGRLLSICHRDGWFEYQTSDDNGETWSGWSVLEKKVDESSTAKGKVTQALDKIMEIDTGSLTEGQASILDIVCENLKLMKTKLLISEVAEVAERIQARSLDVDNYVIPHCMGCNSGNKYEEVIDNDGGLLLVRCNCGHVNKFEIAGSDLGWKELRILITKATYDDAKEWIEHKTTLKFFGVDPDWDCLSHVVYYFYIENGGFKFSTDSAHSMTGYILGFSDAKAELLRRFKG